MKTLAIVLAALGAIQSLCIFLLAAMIPSHPGFTPDPDFTVRMLSLALASFLFPFANLARLAGKR